MIKKEQLENNVKENNVKENNVREYKNNNLENDKYLVYIISKDNLNEWEHFNSKYGNVFQSAGFFNVLNQTGTKTKILVVKQNSEIVGGVLFFFPLSGFKRFFSEMRVVSGPIINDDKVLSLILRSLSQIAIENKVTSIQLKMPFINKEKILINEDFTPLYTGPAYSFNVDLSTNKEELKNNLNKRTRNAINKAEREGVTIEEGHNIDIIYNLYMIRVRM